MSLKRVFRTRSFARFMKKAGVADADLWNAVEEMIEGLVDADLGGCVLKKRIAVPGQGKRGGARTIVATKLEARWFFIFGFKKNERSNVGKDELKALQELARELLGLNDEQLSKALAAGEIEEVRDGKCKAEKSNPE